MREGSIRERLVIAQKKALLGIIAVAISATACGPTKVGESPNSISGLRSGMELVVNNSTEVHDWNAPELGGRNCFLDQGDVVRVGRMGYLANGSSGGGPPFAELKEKPGPDGKPTGPHYCGDDFAISDVPSGSFTVLSASGE